MIADERPQPPAHVPYTQYERAINRIQTLERENSELRSEIQWRDQLDRVSAKVLSQNQKAALRGTLQAIKSGQPVETGKYKGMIQIESWSLARKTGMCKDTFLSHLNYCADNGILAKRNEQVRDPDTNEIKHTNIYVAPTELTPHPLRYQAGKDRNHGGDRRCKCGSDRLLKKVEKRVTIVCMDCGLVLEDITTSDSEMLNGHLASEFTSEFTGNTIESTLEPERQIDVAGLLTESSQQPTDITNPAPTESNPQRQFDVAAPTAVIKTTLEPEEPERQFDVAAPAGQNDSFPVPNIQIQKRKSPVLDTPTFSIPITPPPVGSAEIPSEAEATRYLVSWLKRRLGVDAKGNRGRLIFATGSTVAEDKYKSKPVHCVPDLAAYLQGHRDHLYGSWLRGSSGNSYVLAFDIDRPEQHAMVRLWQEQLAAAGIRSIYWTRGAAGRERGHLEFYFDAPINPDQARAWLISLCPSLADISECFPARDKAHNALSWPLWQRINDQVQACRPVAYLDDGFMIQGDITNRVQLAWLVQKATISADLVEAYEMPISPDDDLALEYPPPRPEPPRASSGGGLLEKSSDQDIIKLVIDEFNASHSWEQVTGKWGGVKDGCFRNGERGESTPSVKIDADGRWACDYGDLRGGKYPRKLDKYEVWCRANHVNKKQDLDERCRDYRRQLVAQAPESPPVEQRPAPPFSVGQPVTWRQVPRGGYGYVYPVDGTVEAIGAKRITIRVRKLDGTEALVAVQPTSLVPREAE